MRIGEAFVGSGGEVAHLNVVLGPEDGPVGTAWATALATPTAGHQPFLVVIEPGIPVRPYTLFVSKATLAGETHSKLTWGPAQAGVAAGVADAVAVQHIDGTGVLIAAVWVDPAAQDADLVFENNRQATREAIGNAVSGYPPATAAVERRERAWNPFFRPAGA